MTALTPYLRLLLEKQYLSKNQAETVMTLMLEQAHPYQVAAVLSTMKYRGETAEEVAGMVIALAKKARTVDVPYPVLDIVGTGGDGANTVNISTGAAILAAACGIPVAKHGNRSVSSRSGSADVLEALGLEIEIPPDRVKFFLDEMNIAFLYAPYYHSSLEKIGDIRRGLKVSTLFNLLGPLLNPAKAEYALIGVASESALDLISQVVIELGYIRRALVYYGNGLDELTPLGPVEAYEISEGKRVRVTIDPVSLGFTQCKLVDLVGGDATLNASILLEIFAGRPGPIADSLAFTAGAGLYIFGSASTLQNGIERARTVLQKGEALQVLEKWKILQSLKEKV